VGSHDHQAFFWYNKEDGELSVTIHLCNRQNFFKRLWAGLKYAFGFKSKFGAWDEFIMAPKDQKELIDYLLLATDKK
jgi:hypothetical protein